MNHSPEKCHVCGEYHCLAGCVPLEQCLVKSGDKLIARLKARRNFERIEGKK